MKAALLAAAVAVAGWSGGADARPAYARRAQEKGAPVAQVQFAILHALLGWRGGQNPPYAVYEPEDAALLASVGVKVAPLANPVDRALLDGRLAELRQEHNFGVPAAYNARRPISLDELIARHRELIARYANHVFLVAPNGLPPQKFPELAWQRQNGLVWGLVAPLKEMAGAADEGAFNAAVDRFNAAAARFGKGDRVPSRPGLTRQEISAEALAIYKRERAEADRLSVKAGL